MNVINNIAAYSTSRLRYLQPRQSRIYKTRQARTEAKTEKRQKSIEVKPRQQFSCLETRINDRKSK